MAFTRLEVEGLVERGLAHWIADRADPAGAVVFAPPYRTTTSRGRKRSVSAVLGWTYPPPTPARTPPLAESPAIATGVIADIVSQ